MTKPCSIRTREMQGSDLQALKVNRERLLSELHHSCTFGTGQRWGSASSETGMCRLALSDADKQARDWFVEKTKSLGCNVTIDEMGNIFAVRAGQKDGPATFAGSHLDSQPRGGRYDGILGVLAGIEMLQVLEDHKVETEFPVGVVNWTNEEGARFPVIMIASGVWAGKIPLERAHQLQEVGGGSATMKSELERIGYIGSTPASHLHTPMAAHFELHIEQGPILETNKQKVGVVVGVQAYRWFTVDVTGQEAHAGTTPLANRADALLLSSYLIAHSHRLATKLSAVATTGIIVASPGSVNTIPGHVRFKLDIRAPTDETLERLETEMKRDFGILAAGGDVDGLRAGGTTGQPQSIVWQTDTVTPATTFHSDCVEIVRASAASVTSSDNLFRDMTSGAGHDSVHTSLRCPTSMIFVPSRNGISHNPTEYTSPEDCSIGAEVLLQSVLRYDRLRAEKEG
ncbi:putative Peptidase M20 dimerization domain-containing protein [Seiridium unicorne]|uniref:Peptidase M20 dimerization domain-containing protein n=1 Tax=Seiridium unicorne TaxID=138068 RepID=A0ABR2V8U2_9PEZI